MIYIYTHAYNAAKTLPRAIKSILSQTYGEFVWLLCDNASTDETKDIILDIAARDKRVVPELREINHRSPEYNGPQLFWLPALLSFCEKGNENDFFCTLDADDEYEPAFFENMLRFMDENALEVAACGHDFINAKTNLIESKRILSQSLILDSDDKFSEYFPCCHQFMRTVWGKLYRLPLIKQCDYENYINKIAIPYGLDTIFCMRAFSCAERAGILAQSLHKYYISPASVSNKYDDQRVISDRILDKKAHEFLLEKTGRVSEANQEFLNFVYVAAISDTIGVLLKSDVELYKKLWELHSILACEASARAISSEFLHIALVNLRSSCLDVFGAVLGRINQNEITGLICGCICALNPSFKPFLTPESLKALIDEGFVAVGLHKNNEKLIIAEALKLPNAPQAMKLILPMVRENILLRDISLDFLKAHQPVVSAVYVAKLQEAQEKIIANIESDEPVDYLLQLTELGINIAALQKDMGLFTGLKIIKAKLLLQEKKFGEAGAVLIDLAEMLPGDPEIQELIRECGSGGRD